MRKIKQVVYVDVLFALNMIISFFLVSAARKLCRQVVPTVRVLVGAALGGIYSLAVFLPELNTAVSVVLRLGFMLLLALVVFGFGGVKRFTRCYLALVAVSFLLAGAIMAVWFAFKPQALLIKNGSVYLDVGFVSLVAFAAAAYVAVCIVKRLVSPEKAERAECAVTLCAGDCVVNVNGIVDTGNSLRDSFTGKMVSVIDKASALSLLPFEAAECIAAWDFEKLPPYMHLTVASTVGGEGLLPVFTADSMSVRLGEKVYFIEKPSVAVSANESFGKFAVLINSGLIGEDEIDKKVVAKNKTHFSEKKQRRFLHKRFADPACAVDLCPGKADNAAHRAGR